MLRVKPLAPKDVLTPPLLRLNQTPGSILIRLRNRKLIDMCRVATVKQHSVISNLERYQNRPLKATPKFAMGIRASVDAQEMAAKIHEFNNLFFITMPLYG